MATLTGPEGETPEALTEYATEVAQPIASALVENAPDDQAEDAQAISDAIDEVAETGESGPFEEAGETIGRLTAAAAASCGWDSSSVTATEYAFAGVESSYSAGAVQITLSNEGKEQHEFVAFKKKDGVTESFDEIFDLPEEEAEQKVDFAGATEASPGEEGSTVLDLQAGEYVAVCFIPVGATPEAAEQAETSGKELEGPPHFTQGMKAEFSVS